jgi:hypothetical protein
MSVGAIADAPTPPKAVGDRLPAATMSYRPLRARTW